MKKKLYANKCFAFLAEHFFVGGKIMLYACEEHIDYVMEDFIDQYEAAPTMEQLEHNENKICAWCKKTASYMLALEEESEATTLAD
jgi:CxxH/CxxC protein (TIGR04129 family)